MKKKIKILMVDDHPFFRQGVTFFLESVEDFQLIGDCSSGERALEVILKDDIDVILMDLQMSGIDGIETSKRILELNPTLRILIVTSFGNAEKIQEALAAGAAGYCLKDAPPDELATAIRAVAEGGTYLGRGINLADVARFSSSSSAQEVLKVTIIDSLTHREKEVLALIAKGFGNKAIAEQLYVSEKTAKTHVANILHKLEVKTRTQAALLASKHNLY